MTEEQKKAYLAANYHVDLPEDHIEIPPRGPCPALQKLHRKHHVGSSAFVTAWNPDGILTPSEINEKNQQELLKFIDGRWTYFHGMGTDPDGVWPGEPSVLILGIERTDALKLAQRFHQVAILFVNKTGDVELLPVSPGTREDNQAPRTIQGNT